MKHISESGKLENKPVKGNPQGLPTKGKLGGPRPGGGRPKGSLNDFTKRKLAAEREMKELIMQQLYTLLQSQMILARGVNLVYRIERHKGKKGQPDKVEHVLVTDPDEIKEFLDEHEGGDGMVEDVYYYITTKIPDNRALDSLIDRLFGKARQNVGLDGGEDDKPITVRNILNVIEQHED